MIWTTHNSKSQKLKLIKVKDKKQLSGGGSIMGVLSLVIAASNVVALTMDSIIFFKKQNAENSSSDFYKKNNWSENDILNKQQMIKYSSKNENTITYL